MFHSSSDQAAVRQADRLVDQYAFCIKECFATLFQNFSLL